MPLSTTILEYQGIIPVQKPLFHAPPLTDVIQKWVENNKKISPHPLTQQIVEKLADNIVYVSFEKFLAQLKMTISAFNDRCKEPYILCIPEIFNYAPERKPIKGTNLRWVAGLALEDCNLKMPEKVISSFYLKEYLSSHPEMKNILILDDTACRGQQFQADLLLDNIPEDESLNFYFGIPFLASMAKKFLEGVAKFKNLSINILPYSPMPLVEEILNEEELDAVNRCSHSYFARLQLNVTLTYFDHKLPDFMSTFMSLETGQMLPGFSDSLSYYYKITSCENDSTDYRLVSADEWNQEADEFRAEFPEKRLVPFIIPPYKLHQLKQREELLKAIDQNLAGTRTNYPVIDLDEIRVENSEQYKTFQSTLNSQLNNDNNTLDTQHDNQKDLLQTCVSKPYYQRCWNSVNKDNNLLKARALLNDYTRNNSAINRFFHGNWNRHHIDEVQQIVRDIDSKVAERKIVNIEQLLNRLNRIQLHNLEGSLARRIAFIEENNVEETYADSYQNDDSLVL